MTPLVGQNDRPPLCRFFAFYARMIANIRAICTKNTQKSLTMGINTVKIL